MADVDFEDFEGGYGDPMAAAPKARASRLVNLAGALTSVGLVLGLGYWGYSIAVRNAHGIPVVRALEGPMRIAPENPGGEVADHQGLSVNRIAAEGTAAPVADQMVLAPRPVDLTDEDLPGLAGTPPVIEAAVPAGPEAPAALVPASAPATAVAPTPPAATNVEALVTALAAPAPQDEETAAAETVETASLGSIDAALAEANAGSVDGGVGASLRPLRRPQAAPAAAPAATAATDPATPVAADAAPAQAAIAAVTDIDPATLAAGTRLVQLGAYDTAEEARADWDRLSGRFGDLIAGKGRVVQQAQSGGRSFYRLRAEGFADEADARRFCAALLAENAACIPVAVR